jgi:hypothetical protein
VSGESHHEWRQGSVLPRSVVEAKGWLDAKGQPCVCIVATHDCDCVAAVEVEPYLELVRGRRVGIPDGSVSNAKSSRRLHIQLFDASLGKEQTIELVAEPKSALFKSELDGIDPDHSLVISNENLRVLKRWLQNRYERPTFPDSFNDRLAVVRDRIEKILKTEPRPSALHGIYMYYDPPGEVKDASEPYLLDIVLLYDTAKEGSAEDAQAAADQIREAFEKKFKIVDTPALGLQWDKIELRQCEAVSDLHFSFADLLEYTRWSVDHISLRQRPQVPIPDAA